MQEDQSTNYHNSEQMNFKNESNPYQHNQNSQNQTAYSKIQQTYLQLDKELQAYANQTLEVQEQNIHGIKINVCGSLQKGSGISKYTVYLIRGQDKNGPIEVYRRFNQFWALRAAMIQRWPGCFIPAVPDKNAMVKFDDQIVTNRQRFLNDFVKKVAFLPYLYYGQQFQTLIRSKQIEITSLFEKWPKPSYQDIINKYRDSFSELAGKEINSQTSVKISSFNTFLKTQQTQLPSYKQMAKSLAISRDNLNQKISKVSTRILPDYQKNCLIEYTHGDENALIYGNSINTKLQQHGNIIQNITQKNPYWLIYDLIKFQQRDGQAFLEAINKRDSLQLRKQDIEIKIKENENEIQQISLGKSTFKTMISTGTKEEVKYKLQIENQQLHKQKDNVLILADIISALLAYITIDQYKLQKKKFYAKTITRVGGFQINFVQNMYEVWNECYTLSDGLLKTSKKTI